MDYSLLVGVVQRKFEVMDRTGATELITEHADVFQRDADGGMHATVVEGPGTYYMGIIDVLQHWNWEKKLERFLKIYLKWEGSIFCFMEVYVLLLNRWGWAICN